MIGTPSLLSDLLADCEARGIRLALASDGGLTIDARRDALTPELLERLRAHKGELLTMLRPAPKPSCVDRPDLAAVWCAALDVVDGDPLFPPDLMEALRAADVRWDDERVPIPSAPAEEASAKPKPPGTAPAKAVCRCGSMRWRDVPIHEGQSVRRDCRSCGRFLGFPVWYGKELHLVNSIR